MISMIYQWYQYPTSLHDSYPILSSSLAFPLDKKHLEAASVVEKLKGLECQAAPGCLVWQCPGCHLAHAAMWVKRDLQRLPSGKHTKSYWKWPFSSWIFPLKMVIFHSKLLNYQRVSTSSRKFWAVISPIFRHTHWCVDGTHKTKTLDLLKKDGVPWKKHNKMVPKTRLVAGCCRLQVFTVVLHG
jgi:hypothetical protein